MHSFLTALNIFVTFSTFQLRKRVYGLPLVQGKNQKLKFARNLVATSVCHGNDVTSLQHVQEQMLYVRSVSIPKQYNFKRSQ